MAIKINGDTVIDNRTSGVFSAVNPGVYTTATVRLVLVKATSFTTVKNKAFKSGMEVSGLLLAAVVLTDLVLAMAQSSVQSLFTC